MTVIVIVCSPVLIVIIILIWHIGIATTTIASVAVAAGTRKI